MLKKPAKSRYIAFSIILVVILFFLLSIIPRSTSPEKVTLIVKSGTSLLQIGRQLKEEGLIWSNSIFTVFSTLQGGKLMAGEYTLERNMSTLSIIRKMAHGERNIYILRILEGDTIYNVADSFEKLEIMGNGAFLKLSRDRTFLGNLGVDAPSLEGYLMPDTYHYSKEVDAEQFVAKIVERTKKFFDTEEIRSRMTEIGFNMHKTLILASMIEREAKMNAEKPLISAVFHNRLARGMSLDCDPTVIYGTGKFGTPITKSDLITHTPYNTYAFRGLPKGPIANPDRNSIRAALYPASNDYLYFVSKNDGTHVFSKNMDEHNRYVTVYQRTKKTKKQ